MIVRELLASGRIIVPVSYIICPFGDGRGDASVGLFRGTSRIEPVYAFGVKSAAECEGVMGRKRKRVNTQARVYAGKRKQRKLNI